MKTTMSGIPKGSITKFYPGTFDARSTYSFQVLFTEIRFRVEERMFRGSEEQYIPIPAVDIVDLLSGHFAPVEFLAPTGVKQLKFIRLKNISFIHDEIRLLLSDMGFGSETPYVIDRLSQMALGWDQLVFRFNESSAMVISPRATKGLFVHNQNPDFFVSVEDADTVDAEDGAPTTFGDVIVEIDTAAQYASSEPRSSPRFRPCSRTSCACALVCACSREGSTRRKRRCSTILPDVYSTFATRRSADSSCRGCMMVDNHGEPLWSMHT